MKGLKKFSERVYHIDKKVQMLQREGWRKMFDCYFLKQADMQKVKKGGVFLKRRDTKGETERLTKKKHFFAALSQSALTSFFFVNFWANFTHFSGISIFDFEQGNVKTNFSNPLEVVRVYKAKPVLALSTSPTKSSSTLKQFVGNLPTNCFECVWPFCWVGA